MRVIFLLIFSLAAYSYPCAQLSRYQVVISEIMADPTPPAGLPNAEWVEITNLSASTIDLYGWKFSDASGTATIGTHYLLRPDSMVILCSNANVAVLSSFGKAIGLSSFPSLDNDGDLLVLRTPTLMTMHAVPYDPEWYGSATKEEGGWSLEMIDLSTACQGRKNWRASLHTLGGTPGKPNSVKAVNMDEAAPVLLRTYCIDSISLVLLFDETLDSAIASASSRYMVDGIQPAAVTVLPPLYQSVLLKLNSPLSRDKVTEVKVSSLRDCSDNETGAGNHAKAGLPSNALGRDLVVNEILFNPHTTGYDFVEIFNRSSKVIDLSGICLANRDGNGLLASLKKLSSSPYYIFPGEYRVFTEDALSLAILYLVKETPIELPQLPALADDEGSVVLVAVQNSEVIDEVHYKDDWHFALLSDAEGISLERIDPDGKSDEAGNWHSAASTAGYGTPGYENSQFKKGEELLAEISITPKIISPDNDGSDDVLMIHYSVDVPGYVANVIIFDAAGHRVYQVANNQLLGIQGRWTWDGLGTNRQKLPRGRYILLAEIYDLKGRRKRWKESFVLAAR